MACTAEASRLRRPRESTASRRIDPDGAGASPAELIITGADGFQHGDDLLQTILYHVDEAIYNNVFAVGLEELQELATLNGTEAASLLYNLTRRAGPRVAGRRDARVARVAKTDCWTRRAAPARSSSF